MRTRRLLTFVALGSGAIVVWRLFPFLLEKLPEDLPPKLVKSILPRLQQQNEEIIGLLRAQNELLRREHPVLETRESRRVLKGVRTA